MANEPGRLRMGFAQPLARHGPALPRKKGRERAFGGWKNEVKVPSAALRRPRIEDFGEQPEIPGVPGNHGETAALGRRLSEWGQAIGTRSHLVLRPYAESSFLRYESDLVIFAGVVRDFLAFLSCNGIVSASGSSYSLPGKDARGGHGELDLCAPARPARQCSPTACSRPRLADHNPHCRKTRS
jgi:hypothetical protein